MITAEDFCPSFSERACMQMPCLIHFVPCNQKFQKERQGFRFVSFRSSDLSTCFPFLTTCTLTCFLASVICHATMCTRTGLMHHDDANGTLLWPSHSFPLSLAACSPDDHTGVEIQFRETLDANVLDVHHVWDEFLITCFPLPATDKFDGSTQCLSADGEHILIFSSV